MKPVEVYDKLRGGYYTPKVITKFITEWAIRSSTDTVLEPSCGDGSFLEDICSRLAELGCSKKSILTQTIGIELDSSEARKAAKYPATVINGDYFTYYHKHNSLYDVVAGNPPFIRYQNFNEKYRKIAFELMQKHGFHPNRLTNIWLPFLLLSCKALTDKGRIGMVIPAELFQVDYAAEARSFISEYFDSLILITFKQLIFDDIQQEVVLLLGERKSKQKGIRVIELQGIEDLIQGVTTLDTFEVKELDHSSEKWIKYYLSNNELCLLKKLANDPRLSLTTDLFEVNVGLVSGENDFFVIGKEIVDRFNLYKHVIPIVSKAEQVSGLLFSNNSLDEITNRNKRVFLFNPNDKPFDELSKEEQTYIKYGEKSGFHRNYKCRIRKRWYIVPKTWLPEAFLIRQANLFTKIILNETDALVTDTLHKIRFLDNVDGRLVAAAFMNTLTLSLSETIGRSYGGGVLTFEPGEIRKLRIPMIGAEKLDFSKVDSWLRNGEIDQILTYTDDVLLRNGLGLKIKEIKTLHDIWLKLRDRRIARKMKRDL
ncbi:N-6 DNA methylase [Treponema primitia]|uniref:N-6 DNA methylase n=1 Tax=Treponema primitia TaxID=88058 RepID=UPI0002555134|nr:N-6 DNA methylase [Treponema primitia]